MGRIMTVRGEIDSSELGLTLPHEHVLVDFGGAETAGQHRYDADEVVAVMRPYLAELKDEGVTGFVDCSPMYLARDPRVLLRLSEATGLHILTNTGQYKEPFLPAETFILSPEKLAEQWVSEWENGIDGTQVRPGFIKTAVEPVPLADTQKKVIAAAAITSNATGLTIGTHTVKGIPALQILRILEQYSVDPTKWIFIHAHLESDFDLMRMVVREGAWIELDGLGAASDEVIMTGLLKLLDAGFEKQVLLSHDAGWYTVGEEGGGTPRPYTHLTRHFIPLMREFGVSEASIETITVENPARAFSIG
jgi:phosphotriesterase-related protein